MTDIPDDTTTATPASEAPGLVALTEWASDLDKNDKAPLAVLTVSTEPSYLSFFTEQGADVTTHYLEQTETWSGGYAHCLGHDCPGCKAQINRKRFVLLPVADLTDGVVKILRVPAEKGPGKLLTEILKVLMLSNRAQIITKISRTMKYQYVVEPHREEALNPDIAVAIKRFVEQLETGVIDLRSVVTSMPAAEMLEHERIAKRLELEGQTR